MKLAILNLKLYKLLLPGSILGNTYSNNMINPLKYKGKIYVELKNPYNTGK